MNDGTFVDLRLLVRYKDNLDECIDPVYIGNDRII